MQIRRCPSTQIAAPLDKLHAEAGLRERANSAHAGHAAADDRNSFLRVLLETAQCSSPKKKQDSGCAASLTIQMDGLRRIFSQMQQVSKLAGCGDQRKFHSSADRRSRWGTLTRPAAAPAPSAPCLLPECRASAARTRWRGWKKRRNRPSRCV